MIKLFFILLTLLSIETRGQSFSLPDLEQFYSEMSYNSRADILLQKGFLLESKNKSGKYTKLLFRKGESERYGKAFTRETIGFITGKDKHIVYGTANSGYYQMLKSQISQTCTFMKEERSAEGDITQTFKKGDTIVMVTISPKQVGSDEKLTVYNIILING